MTSSFDERDPLAGASPADIDARFSAIVSGLSPQMSWDSTETAGLRGSGDAPAAPTVDPFPTDRSSESDDADRAAERARRREFRRLERAAEVAEFEADRARKEAEYAADDAHFVPSDPPPLPRLRRRTVSALLLLVVGVVLMAHPGIVPAPQDLVLVVGMVPTVGALAIFLSMMRRRRGDPGDGWDDGARV